MTIKPFNIRLPEDMHYELKVKATKEKKTLQEIMFELVKEYLANDQDLKEPTKSEKD